MITRVKKILKKIFKKTGYTITKSSIKKNISNNSDFLKAYEKYKKYSMVSEERLLSLFNSVQHILKNDIEGDFVECGVWKGGSSMLVADAFIRAGDVSRNIWMYDTYGGMSKPGKHDVNIKSEEAAIHRWEGEDRGEHNSWCYAPLEEVKENMHSTGYPKEKLFLVKGFVEDTIPLKIPEKISILRLDTDWYESTYHELVHLFPRLEAGGVLIIDDYGTWEGSKKAVDQYIEENNINISLQEIGYSAVGIKL